VRQKTKKGVRPTRKKAERKGDGPRRDSRMLLASIVESSDDAIIGKDLSGIITSWNRGAERLYGYKAKEVLGQNISVLAPPGRAEEVTRILERIRRGQTVEHYRSVRVAKDGRHLQVSITISPIRAGGKIIGASAIARDITALEGARQALEESELRAQALFETAAQAIFLVDGSGRIVMANPATERMLGYAKGELAGQPIELLVPEKLRAGHVAHRNHYFGNPQNRPMGLGLDLQARRKDGSTFDAEISLSYIQSAQGTWAVAFVSDISKRKADEQAIRQQREDLRRLAGRLMTAQDDERRRIARNLHDDLSQTLAYLAMDIGKLLGKHSSSPELQADLHALQRRAAEAAESVRRISHQLHPSILDDIGLEAALEQYCEEFEERAGIRTNFSSQDVPESLPREVASSLYHIFQECLRNVAKHSRAEEVFVTLASAGNVLHLTVKDEGVGLTGNQPQAGTSIGIVGMRERARLVNGTLSLESRSGVGTEVSVAVPLTPVA